MDSVAYLRVRTNAVFITKTNCGGHNWFRAPLGGLCKGWNSNLTRFIVNPSILTFHVTFSVSSCFSHELKINQKDLEGKVGKLVPIFGIIDIFLLTLDIYCLLPLLACKH